MKIWCKTLVNRKLWNQSVTENYVFIQPLNEHVRSARGASHTYFRPTPFRITTQKGTMKGLVGFGSHWSCRRDHPHGYPSNRQLDCLVYSLIRLTKIAIKAPLWLGVVKASFVHFSVRNFFICKNWLLVPFHYVHILHSSPDKYGRDIWYEVFW